MSVFFASGGQNVGYQLTYFNQQNLQSCVRVCVCVRERERELVMTQGIGSLYILDGRINGGNHLSYQFAFSSGMKVVDVTEDRFYS